MDITTYESITGTTVQASQTAKITATIAKTKLMIEDMLGYSLDVPAVTENRDFRIDIQSVTIDPCTAVNSVTLEYRNGETELLSTDEYREIKEKNYIKYLYLFDNCNFYDIYYRRIKYLKDTTLVVNADWAFTEIPDDLNLVWAEMVEFYSDDNKKNKIKSQTLGTHSYTKEIEKEPEYEKFNNIILRKYAGGNGSLAITKVL